MRKLSFILVEGILIGLFIIGFVYRRDISILYDTNLVFREVFMAICFISAGLLCWNMGYHYRKNEEYFKSKGIKVSKWIILTAKYRELEKKYGK